MQRVEFEDFHPHHHRSRAYWWVNQGKTYSEEGAGGFIWAPNRDRGGGVPVHWSTMKHVRAGDVVFNYANGSIRAVSTAKGSSYDYENEAASADWDKRGQRVDLEYHAIEPLPLAKIQPFIKEITERIGSKNSPYDVTGGIKQGYLFDYSLQAAKIIRRIYGRPFPEPVESYLTETECIAPVQREPIIDLMLTKKQVIFYGPPGTGKTFNARNTTLALLGHSLDSEVISSPVLPQPADVRSWIFQANPARYDLLAALSDPSHRETTWTVNQHGDSIRSGDRAFIWMSGPRAGIYAVADITSDPHTISPDAEDDRYWSSSADRGASRLAVSICIIRNLARKPLLKSELAEVPELSDLRILKFAQATNFAVTEKESEAILRLIGAAPVPD